MVLMLAYTCQVPFWACYQTAHSLDKYESIYQKMYISKSQKLCCGKEASSFVFPLSVVSDNDSCIAYSLKNTITVVQKANWSWVFLYEQVMKGFQRGKRRPPTSEGSERDGGSSKLDQRWVRKQIQREGSQLLAGSGVVCFWCQRKNWGVVEQEHDWFMTGFIFTHSLWAVPCLVLCGFLPRENFVSSSLLESLLIRCVCSLSASAAVKLEQRKTSLWGKEISLT